MPTISSNSTARFDASCGRSFKWYSSPSVSWRSTVSNGFSEVDGSWNTKPIC